VLDNEFVPALFVFDSANLFEFSLTADEGDEFKLHFLHRPSVLDPLDQQGQLLDESLAESLDVVVLFGLDEVFDAAYHKAFGEFQHIGVVDVVGSNSFVTNDVDVVSTQILDNFDVYDAFVKSVELDLPLVDFDGDQKHDQRRQRVSAGLD